MHLHAHANMFILQFCLYLTMKWSVIWYYSDMLNAAKKRWKKKTILNNSTSVKVVNISIINYLRLKKNPLPPPALLDELHRKTSSAGIICCCVARALKTRWNSCFRSHGSTVYDWCFHLWQTTLESISSLNVQYSVCSRHRDTFKSVSAPVGRTLKSALMMSRCGGQRSAVLLLSRSWRSCRTW